MPSNIDEKDLKRWIETDDESFLLEQLGMRARAVELDFAVAGNPKAAITMSGMMGPKEELKKLGRRILKRWNKSAYEVVCGDDPDDAKDRAALKQAVGVGDLAVAGALATTLVSLGMAPLLAPIVAAIIVRKFLRPTYGEFCGFWKEHV